MPLPLWLVLGPLELGALVWPHPGVDPGGEVALSPEELRGRLYLCPLVGGTREEALALVVPGEGGGVFSFGCYSDSPRDAAQACTPTGLVLSSVLPSAHRARWGGIANGRQRPAWVAAFVHSLDFSHFPGVPAGPGLRG